MAAHPTLPLSQGSNLEGLCRVLILIYYPLTDQPYPSCMCPIPSILAGIDYRNMFEVGFPCYILAKPVFCLNTVKLDILVLWPVVQDTLGD
ncbi:hypothetical protein WG66_005464 [Moniliophthora roreri]|nr:hypothetical protein WG66_005464 [Moniliophthora roreri]